MNIAPEEMPREIERLEEENERLNTELELYKDNHEHLNTLLEQKNNIIKEVREYIEDNTYKSNGTEYMDLTGIKELLEILDKGE